MTWILERLRHRQPDAENPSGVRATLSMASRAANTVKVSSFPWRISDSGSTLSVYPVAAVVPTARQSGVKIVVINGGPTEMDPPPDTVLRGTIGELLSMLMARSN